MLALAFNANILNVHAKDKPIKKQPFQGVFQTGYQIPVSYKDRLGPTLSVGLILDEQVLYKFTHVLNDKNLSNQEHSIDILVSKYQKPKQWAIGASYYKATNSKDLILPCVSFYNFRVGQTNFGYNVKVGFSVYSLGWAIPFASPIAQFNLIYRLGRKTY